MSAGMDRTASAIAGSLCRGCCFRRQINTELTFSKVISLVIVGKILKQAKQQAVKLFSLIIITMNYFVLNLTLRPPQREKHPSGLSVKTLSPFSVYVSKVIERYGCDYFSLK